MSAGLTLEAARAKVMLQRLTERIDESSHTAVLLVARATTLTSTR